MNDLQWLDEASAMRQLAVWLLLQRNRDAAARAAEAAQTDEYRRLLRQRAVELGQGGLRDATRELLAVHYDTAFGRFRQQFVVGKASGVCDRAVG